MKEKFRLFFLFLLQKPFVFLKNLINSKNFGKNKSNFLSFLVLTLEKIH